MSLPAIEDIAAFHDELTDLRHDIHAHPELGFEETRTSDIVAEKLESFGLEVHRGLGKTGEANVNRNRSLIMASEDFSYMLEKCPGAYINIGNGDGPEACMVHNPGYDFNDEILALGAGYWVKLVEARLAKEELAA